ncbi:hypothetical protein PIROE2DRAFT_6796 [Piromyces sp. E2]|nr:hypothetical protein PIROE2DRAFT_6796 [Piromyces sp. E2]|eukprot:OUM66084.1 hypothetical protein PIROE2DRAFT_6796 [Piromyces sp. E2]
MTVYRTIYSSYVLPIMASTLTVLIDKLGPGRNPNDFSFGNQAPYSIQETVDAILSGPSVKWVKTLSGKPRITDIDGVDLEAFGMCDYITKLIEESFPLHFFTNWYT